MRRLWASYRSAYAGLPRAAWLLAGAQLVNASGTMVVFFLTLYLTAKKGIPLEHATGVMTGYGLGMLAGTLLGGALCDRIGPNAVQRSSLCGSALLLLVMSTLSTLPWILATAVVWGGCAAMLFPANASAMAAVCPEPVRARGFVLHRLANNLGVAVGPVLGGVLAQRYDYRLLFWVDGATSLGAAVILWRLFPPRAAAPSRAGRAEVPRLALHRDGVLWALLASTFGLSLVVSQVFSTFAPCLRDTLGMTEPLIGLMLAVNAVLIVLVQMPLIHRVERFSRTRVAALGAVLFALGFGAMPLARGPGLLAVTVAVWTVGEMLAFPSLMTAVSLRAPEGGQGRYQGVQGLAFSLGMTVGPAVGGKLTALAGFDVLWAAVAVVAMAAAGLLAAVSRRAYAREDANAAGIGT